MCVVVCLISDSFLYFYKSSISMYRQQISFSILSPSSSAHCPALAYFHVFHCHKFSFKCYRTLWKRKKCWFTTGFRYTAFSILSQKKHSQCDRNSDNGHDRPPELNPY